MPVKPPGPIDAVPGASQGLSPAPDRLIKALIQKNLRTQPLGR
jgi:hypothetical protein